MISILFLVLIYSCQALSSDDSAVIFASEEDQRTTVRAIGRIQQLASEIATVFESRKIPIVKPMDIGHAEIRIFSGLTLSFDTYPTKCETPFGGILLGTCDITGKTKELQLFSFNHFRRHVDLEFVQNSGEERGRFFYAEDLDHPIAKTDLEKYRGTPTNIIVSDNHSYTASLPYHIYPSTYKITAVDGVRLPELILRPKGLPFSLDLYRKYEKEWLSAKEKYAKTTSG